jgi:hypothetical protein
MAKATKSGHKHGIAMRVTVRTAREWYRKAAKALGRPVVPIRNAFYEPMGDMVGLDPIAAGIVAATGGKPPEPPRFEKTAEIVEKTLGLSANYLLGFFSGWDGNPCLENDEGYTPREMRQGYDDGAALARTLGVDMKSGLPLFEERSPVAERR